jgi:hypothetical protein
MNSKIVASLLVTILFFVSCSDQSNDYKKEISDVLRNEVLNQAKEDLTAIPQTVTIDYCPRSTGGIHDFYSEGDYWWPDPKNPEGKFIRKDGLTNPNNFSAHS